MAITSTRLTELNELAKDFFSNVYMNLVNPETPLKAQFASIEGAMFTGRKWLFGIKSEIGGGAANAGARSTLPNNSEGLFDQGEANVVRSYVTMGLDGLVIEVTKSQQGSYRPAVAEVMEDRLQAHDSDVNRQLFGNNSKGLAVVETDGATTQTLTAGSAYGIAGGGLATKFIYVGDFLEFYDTTLATQRTGATVTAVDHSAGTITLDVDPVTTGGGVGVGDHVFKATSDTDNKIQGEANGLLLSVDNADDNFETIDTGDHSRWQSVVFSNSGTDRPMTDELALQMVETIRSRSRQLPNLVVTTPGIVLKYSELFLPLRRLEGLGVKLEGGYKPLTAIMTGNGAIPVIGDTDAPQSRMFFLNTAAFRMADLVGSQWAQLDGAIFDRITDQDGISGYIRKYWQLITVARSWNGVIEDIEDYDIERRF